MPRIVAGHEIVARLIMFETNDPRNVDPQVA
jgi:hypothetical protein